MDRNVTDQQATSKSPVRVTVRVDDTVNISWPAVAWGALFVLVAIGLLSLSV